MTRIQNRRRRSGRSAAAVLIYLVGFATLLFFVSHYYLIPALQAMSTANPMERKLLSAHARLMLALVLFVLFSGLILTFRIGRFFRPRSTRRAAPTEYVDAWKESGRRLKMSDRDENE
jgi:hypothetical protein